MTTKKDLRSQNDNLKDWRTKRKALTDDLLSRSIEELQNIGGVINQKNVCDMMSKIATPEDIKYKSVITPSAISKNYEYKNTIAEANEMAKIKDSKKTQYPKIDFNQSIQNLKLKAIVAAQESKIKELESIIQRANIKQDEPICCSLEIDCDLYLEIIRNLVRFCLKEGVVFYDHYGNLVKEIDQNILISSKIVKTLNINKD